MHKDTCSPVVIDPFARDNGYVMFTVGDPGSGKSFSSKQNFIRSMEQERDRTGVILEPLNDWTGVAEALDAKRITVGGKLGLNPLGIGEWRGLTAEAMPTEEQVIDFDPTAVGRSSLPGAANIRPTTVFSRCRVCPSTATGAERSGISDTEQFPIYRELATALMKNAENTVWTPITIAVNASSDPTVNGTDVNPLWTHCTTR
jgi:hypothetical protein